MDVYIDNILHLGYIIYDGVYYLCRLPDPGPTFTSLEGLHTEDAQSFACSPTMPDVTCT